jgi:hypothetical protein
MQHRFFPVPLPLTVPEATAVGAGAARDAAGRSFVLLGLVLNASPALLCGLTIEDATLLRDCLADVLDYLHSRHANNN